MSDPVDDLLRLLKLESIEVDLYRGEQPETTRQRMFGGQVLGQALAAAYATVPDGRPLHSLHAYFILPGDTKRSVLYDVERLRDGRSFSTRRTAAVQQGRPIFFLTASFQIEETGYEHQEAAPLIDENPESLPTLSEYMHRNVGWNPDGQDNDLAAIDVRVVPAVEAEQTQGRPVARLWMRIAGDLPDDPMLHHCALAYMSDLTLLSASLVPHDLQYQHERVQMASLDHAMWFHRPFRADEWLLYDQVSPSSSGARGLSIGRIFDRQGHLVATTVQEGLIRPARDARS